MSIPDENIINLVDILDRMRSSSEPDSTLVDEARRLILAFLRIGTADGRKSVIDLAEKLSRS